MSAPGCAKGPRSVWMKPILTGPWAWACGIAPGPTSATSARSPANRMNPPLVLVASLFIGLLLFVLQDCPLLRENFTPYLLPEGGWWESRRDREGLSIGKAVMKRGVRRERDQRVRGLTPVFFRGYRRVIGHLPNHQEETQRHARTRLPPPPDHCGRELRHPELALGRLREDRGGRLRPDGPHGNRGRRRRDGDPRPGA